jgi:hypothetical protein
MQHMSMRHSHPMHRVQVLRVLLLLLLLLAKPLLLQPPMLLLLFLLFLFLVRLLVYSGLHVLPRCQYHRPPPTPHQVQPTHPIQSAVVSTLAMLQPTAVHTCGANIQVQQERYGECKMMSSSANTRGENGWCTVTVESDHST